MVVLPHPDSPTRPNVDPTGTAKDTSATAETCPTFRCRTAPAVTVKFFTSRETVSSGASTCPSATGLPPRPPPPPPGERGAVSRAPPVGRTARGGRGRRRRPRDLRQVRRLRHERRR